MNRAAGAGAAAPAGTRTEEVRLAMAWNGGVSLAVWMGGVAVELDTARRARLGDEDQDGTRRSVYRALSGAFDRLLVVDILAGASAGGVNAALLAAAAVRGRRLPPGFLRDRWLELGDFSKLLRPTTMLKPTSLMDGDLFHEALLAAFRAILGDPEADPDALALTSPPLGGAARDVLLDVQATNVLGAQRAFVDAWGETVYATEYRSPIRFRRGDDYTPAALAAAARASASFPAAFAPFPISGDAARLAGYPGKKRWAVDGGLLENAPIRPAIELIPSRRAQGPVERVVCYVNAAPAGLARAADEHEQPSLAEVLGHVVNLPRDARFIDQLRTIEEAVVAGEESRSVADELLQLPLPELTAAAAALLPAYRRRRARQSLQEIVTPPGEPLDTGVARRAYAHLPNDWALPWIPETVQAPAAASEWRWGIRAAQRILVLQLDVLRSVRDRVPAEPVVEAHSAVDDAFATLDEAGERFYRDERIRTATRALATPGALDGSLAALERRMHGFRCDVYAALRNATELVYDALGQLDEPQRLERLFGPGAERGWTDGAFRAFLGRALAIEVVRRAFASDRELEPAQPLAFVQVTPSAPCPLLTERPFRDPGPRSGRAKLTGDALLNFSAFYRRSWRVNDFMWGRLDAAARIVDLLVSPARAGSDAVDALVDLLLPQGDDAAARDSHWLVREALDDAAVCPGLPEAVLAAAAGGAGDDALEERLRATLTADLAADGFATRVLCTRAAQYEILRQELPCLVTETVGDGLLGCFTEPLRLELAESLGPGDSLEAAIVELRQAPSLPERLGRHSRDESTSTLAMRTISHAALVAVASLATVGVPLGRAFAAVRIPFLAIAGATATGWLRRVGLWLGFTAAAAYLSARYLGAGGEVPLSAIWSAPVLLTWVAALSVLAVAVLPLWRAWRAEAWGRKLRQAAWAAGLAVAGGAFAIGYGFWTGGPAVGLTGHGGVEPPGWVAWFALAAALPGAAAIRHLPVPGLLRRGILTRSSRPGWTAAVVAVAAVLLLRHSIGPAWDALGEGWLRGAVAILPAVAAVLAFLYVLRGAISRAWHLARARAGR